MVEALLSIELERLWSRKKARHCSWIILVDSVHNLRGLSSPSSLEERTPKMKPQKKQDGNSEEARSVRDLSARSEDAEWRATS